MPVSDSYHDSLIESLKDPHYAAVYLDTHLEEDEYGFEPELLKLALSHVLEALGSQFLTPEQMIIQIKQLVELMKKPGREAIHHLELWLKSLGLKLTVTVATERREIDHQNDVVNPVEITV